TPERGAGRAGRVRRSANVRSYTAKRSMLAHRLIERKRDGGKLDHGEWRALIMAYAAGHVPDYQMSAFLMACFLKGLDRAETAALTDAMLNSGVRFDLAALGKPRLDKHSIGGV